MGILLSQGASVTQVQPNTKKRKTAKKGVKGEREREQEREGAHFTLWLVHSEVLFLILVLR